MTSLPPWESHRIEGRYHVFPFNDDSYGIEDLSNGDMLRNWRHRGRGKGTVWRGTRDDAESLCRLMNQPAPAELGTIRIVDSRLDPPDRENAIHRAIANNRNRVTPRASPPAFHACTVCGYMVKKGHQCQ